MCELSSLRPEAVDFNNPATNLDSSVHLNVDRKHGKYCCISASNIKLRLKCGKMQCPRPTSPS